MQSVLTYLMLLIAGMVLQAQNTIEVSMTNFDNNDGVVMVGLFNEKGKFLDEVCLSSIDFFLWLVCWSYKMLIKNMHLGLESAY